MRPYFYTGLQSSLIIPLCLILFTNLSAMKADRIHKNEARTENKPGGLFPALSADETIDVLNVISDSTTTVFQASKETSKNGNTTGPDDDIVVSDESEDEEDESYDEEEEDEPEEDDEVEEEEIDEEEEAEEDDSFQADVRSLSDLPLSKLLQVRGELQRIEEDEQRIEENKQTIEKDEEVAETRAIGGGTQSALAKVAKASKAAAAAAFNQQKNRHHSSPGKVIKGYQETSPIRNWPSKQKKAEDPDDSKDDPPRRGGWHFDEDDEEEHDEDHGWISTWSKGKKKKKGDISSVFQMSVTFLAFLAFGGYLLCLIVQAVKGGGPTGPSADGYRPPMTPMVLMMPARLGVRRPRPPNPGRRRRRRRRRRRNTSDSPDEDVPWPAWSDTFDANGTGRLWPNVDLSNLQQVLFDISRELAENGPILR